LTSIVNLLPAERLTFIPAAGEEPEHYKISGGLHYVPQGYYCYSHLLEQNLVPISRNTYEAVVWNGKRWIKLYHFNNCRPKRKRKRKPTSNQIEALAIGRKKLSEMYVCHQCKDPISPLSKNLKIYDNKFLCDYCFLRFRRESEELLDEQEMLGHLFFDEWL